MNNLGERLKFDKDHLRNLEEACGVYIFWNKRLEAIYVGKSVNLKRRLFSYLSQNLNPKTAQMIANTLYFSTIKLTSELEALLLEAKLIKKLQTKFNSQLKDDKNPLYIRVTDESYPRVLTARKPQLNDPKIKSSAVFGPFPSSANTRRVLKILRKIFPYSQHKLTKKPCFYNQMGLCNPCPSQIETTNNVELKRELTKKYLKNIRNIKKILSGSSEKLIKELEKEMRKLSTQEKFEEAKEIRDQIEKLRYITYPITPVLGFLDNPNLAEDLRSEELMYLRKLISPKTNLTKLERIECYDVSHLAGIHPTASMVTFLNGEPEKSLYRFFKIKQEKGKDDLASLKEVARRRSLHFANPPAPGGWGKPDLILVDGGKVQVAVFWGELKNYKIPIVGLAKRFETLVIPYQVRTKLAFKEIRVPKGPALNLLQRLRDEAHRFARRLHHKLLKKELIPKN